MGEVQMSNYTLTTELINAEYIDLLSLHQDMIFYMCQTKSKTFV